VAVLWLFLSLLSTELDAQMTLINALVLSNLCEYRRKSYIAENIDYLGYIFLAEITGLSSTKHVDVIAPKLPNSVK